MMSASTIEHVDDPRVDDYRDVRDADLAGRRDGFVAEGHLVVRTLLERSRFRARSVLGTEAGLRPLGDVLQRAPEGLAVHRASQAVMNAIVGFDIHRGCLAIGEREPAGAEAPVSPVPWDRPGPGDRFLVLEDLTNADNVGGAFRNALAFGVGAVALSERCFDPLYRKAIRVSMGASLIVPFARITPWPDGLGGLRERGVHVVALAPPGPGRAAMPLGRWAPPQDRPVALVVGSEGPGVDPRTLAAADEVVGIEMAPGVDSLNAATASAVALHWLATGGGRLRPA